uniref:Uncharacterized protein n=1 Tax=Pararge aegeria TaxID=116150 RepID=S4NTB4_9NEOP
MVHIIHPWFCMKYLLKTHRSNNVRSDSIPVLSVLIKYGECLYCHFTRKYQIKEEYTITIASNIQSLN